MLKVVFLTLFVDLVGFSIIFPLFPSMLDYYHETEAAGSLFAGLYAALQQFSALAGAPKGDWGIIVLFGGVLGSIYSLLQFLFAPLFGVVSDRIGRRPVLLFSIAGIGLSYVLWFFAGSFTLLVIARVIGGAMSANISTATTVVADITTPRTRSKGMAIIGIAFGLGFIIGPAIGGLSASIDLTEYAPALTAYGINPYSMPAAIAAVLTILNLLLVLAYLPETRPEGAETDAVQRTVNPVRMLHAESYPGVTRTHGINFLYLFAFAGMEFTLTFFAADRFGFGPRENAYMFVFVGLVLALMQGGYVHRFSTRVGIKRMAGHGLVTSIPALALIGLSGHWQSVLALYLGLLLLGIGAAQVTPCLTALVSVYTPPHEQGRIMGVFRSFGALARALGPLFACLLYWRLGPTPAYLLAAFFLLLPVLMTRALPRPETDKPAVDAPEVV